MNGLIPDAFAQAGAGSGPGGFAPILMMVVFVVIFYFLLIRPQQKKAKEHQASSPSSGRATRWSPPADSWQGDRGGRLLRHD